MEENNEIEIFSSTNEYEINQVCSILSDNKIPFIRKDYGSGSYMNIYFGQSIQDKKIFVYEENAKKSLELISTFFSNNIVEEKIEELENIENEDDSTNKYNTIKISFRLFLLGMICIPIILCVIFSFLRF